MDLIFASHNQHKVEEIQKKMPTWITIKSLSDIGWTDEIVENGKTLDENAMIKAKIVAEKTKQACFADDTGLEVFELNNEPGVYSARYAGPQRSDEDNMRKLLENLKNSENRSAQFRTKITLFWNNSFHTFEGKVEGKIALKKTGTHGFGYDPIFVPENKNKSFAEMNMEEKNLLSHRARALSKMIEFIENNKL